MKGHTNAFKNLNPALKPSEPQRDSVHLPTSLMFQSSLSRGSQPDLSLVDDAILKNDLIGLKNLYLKDVSTSLGKTPLHMAANWGHLSAVKYLLDQGENINTLDSKGDSPFIQAIHALKPEVASLLISRGAAISCGENASSPVLHQLIRWNNTEQNQEPLQKLFHQLVRAGANLSELDRWGDTPLILAV
ncbi:MAG: ankyrin repeat domain-containing protein, partial [Cyanobacteria bacterium]|nr:ankyrin repeat domain-containing protein [Cyanobacteriota bacterium]